MKPSAGNTRVTRMLAAAGGVRSGAMQLVLLGRASRPEPAAVGVVAAAAPVVARAAAAAAGGEAADREQPEQRRYALQSCLRTR